MMNEIPIKFKCDADELIGILSCPATPRYPSRAVIISVGGPQYRVGSHRQFVSIARMLSKEGFFVFRFDYRGMGDSSGTPISFEHAEKDIGAAVNLVCHRVKGVQDIFLWGLCDAASANLFYALTDKRITGLVLLNPWCRTEVGEAATDLKYYYTRRIFQKEFWLKFLQNKVDFATSLKEFLSKLLIISFRERWSAATETENPNTLPERMQKGFLKFSGRILLILSGNDMVAKEFWDCVKASREWNKKINSSAVTLIRLDAADHTFSKQKWKEEVEVLTAGWLKE